MKRDRQRAKQKDIVSAIEAEAWEDIRTMLASQPGLHRYIIARLYETDAAQMERTLRSFEIIAETFERERLLDLARRLLWMLNDESGNHCPNSALAMAHIARVHYQVIEPHIPVMRFHATDPGDRMAAICQEALDMIEKWRGSDQMEQGSDGERGIQ
ncbi:MAG TPA: hypothetical protein ENH10_04445 [Bacteroidetes bacterium]|nr:hypothetical protein BMS3Bbin04_01816 [bacterium BMS3Bbin04]HDO65264.1 hypothetical protein [Bacteroidota bacterium]HEX04389.1 hypothetical protein [Bacteroidota bacterium]